MRNAQKGLTVIEVLVVLGIMTIVGGFALVVSLTAYRGSSRHAGRATFVAALQHARAESIDDICEGSACVAGAPHGVSLQADHYVLFQGPSYLARDASVDEAIPADPGLAHSGLSEVVFMNASGDAAQAGDIILTDPDGHVSTTTIGSEGQISWDD
jgi:prepilin-type N-terminal cleavage/methylation domain-containing protein